MQKHPERRKAKRRPILETFSLFVVVPEIALQRLRVTDMSEGGLAFEIESIVEESGTRRFQMGDEMDVQFYLNASLFVPVRCRVVRVESRPSGSKFGLEFISQKDGGVQALASFLRMLDEITGIAQIERSP